MKHHSLLRLANWLFGWPLIPSEPSGYVIIYDRVAPGATEPYEEYYGYFSSPHEARRVWSSYAEGHTSKFSNVKLCHIVQDWS